MSTNQYYSPRKIAICPTAGYKLIELFNEIDRSFKNIDASLVIEIRAHENLADYSSLIQREMSDKPDVRPFQSMHSRPYGKNYRRMPFK